MTPAAIFFFVVLATQFLFTGVLTWLVARRFPARIQLYRYLAPAAMPVLLLVLIIPAYVQTAEESPASIDRLLWQVIGAYGILWLIGILWASMIARWTRR